MRYATSTQQFDSNELICFGLVVHNWDPANNDFNVSIRFANTIFN